MKSLFLLTFLFSVSAMAKVNVIMETSLGKMEIELNDEKAPVTVTNFLRYVDDNYFAGTTFHRVIKNFVIQGGGVLPDMTEKPTAYAPIINEAKNGLSNLRGTLGMARDNDINSATSQFYINTVDNVRLDYQSEQKYGYAVFAKVVNGMEVVDAIRNVSTQTVGDYDDVPVEPILIMAVYRKVE